jgi:hypothetical protein
MHHKIPEGTLWCKSLALKVYKYLVRSRRYEQPLVAPQLEQT